MKTDNQYRPWFILLIMPILLMANTAKPLHIQKIIKRNGKHKISLSAQK